MNNGFYPHTAPFFEKVDRWPLTNSIVSHNGKQFRTDIWQGNKGICYVFVNISNNNIKPFGKKPSEVADLIKNKKIIIEKFI